MKKVILSLMAMALCLGLSAQDKDIQYIPLRVEVAGVQEDFPEAAAKQLENKLNLMLTQHNVVTTDANERFVLVCFAVPQDKDILAGPPTQIIEVMDMTMYIADVKAEMIFSSVAQTVKGIGTTEARAYMDAFKHMNISEDKLDQFLNDGLSKIMEYYDHEAQRIMIEAQAMAVMHDYEHALHHIMLIPSRCKSFPESVQVGLKIFHEYQDYVCQGHLQKARMLWAAEQNAVGAEKAGALLAQIYPDAGCYDDAMALYKEIKGKVLDDWKFEMKQYQDGVDLEKQRIEAMRQIGVAYGKNQKPTTYNYGFLR